ncbi:GreA/GreB family elongation factor [Novosphingobium taihuense]|uniref:Transcription elongation GreA/GreB family factor n=1 Tax=Novosphingobium taihuense TaxID=260085 RepID=A0A7W7EVD3_9SPHN|nr:GreA/GreB family elongation factor [Novosphingobium taihuense]MBB4614941.1 transcription elongation GreA/GreB family factor [Novosphingobium taihuense]TWH84618.1 transcription elongation GreA/GreB family factor [Novosphingobium taihuense]
MSVAFRRESDDEHLEPVFELPIPPGPNLVTERGLALIRAQVAACEDKVQALVTAGAEEAEIKKARREQRYWSTRAATAELVPAPDGEAVGFGCSVHFRLNGKARWITIVGDDEADPAAGLIAWSAPLARAMMEAEEGELVDFGGKAEAIEVLEIKPASVGPDGIYPVG